MEMPGRKYSATGSYRYGFNGKEQDKDISSLTAYDYGFRIYNPAIGRFLSMDPLFKSYPWFTPYQFAGNMPINSIDLDGLENKEMIYDVDINSKGETKIQVSVRDYGENGGVGKRGKGILITYNVRQRTSQKVNWNGKMVNIDLPTNFQTREAFIPEPVKPKKGLFQKLDDWFQSLSGKDGNQGGGFSMTKPLKEGQVSAGGDPNAPSAEHADVIEHADDLISMIGGVGGEKGLIKSIQSADGAEKIAAFFEAFGGALEAGEKIADAYELATEKAIPDPNTVHCLTCAQNGSSGNFLLDSNGHVTWTESKNPASDTVDHHEDPKKSKATNSGSSSKPQKKIIK